MHLRWIGSRSLIAYALVAVLSACGGGNDATSEKMAAGGMSAQRSLAQTASPALGSETVRGTIFGLSGAAATVILGDQAQVMMTTLTDAEGRFEFGGVPYGTFFVKAEARGLALSPAQVLTVNPPGFGALSLISPAPAELVFTASSASTDRFSFHWDTTSGAQEESAHIVTPAVVQFRNESLTPQATVAAATLLARYNVVLSDEGVAWTSEAAARLLATLGTMRTRAMDLQETGKELRLSKWVLSDQFIADDIKIERGEAGDKVTLSSAALVYATPRLVYLDGVPGRYFSKRLHHAALRFVTKDGTDAETAAYILEQRYGVSVKVPDYSQLTLSTTRETDARFAPFSPEELVLLINTFEEMPEGFYKFAGLKYLVRRAVGTLHPSNRSIISTAHVEAGYIELTDAALSGIKASRIILHEKTHFLWAKVLSPAVKNDWIALGDWHQNPAKPNEWLTTRSTGFVSEYAHAISPDEDLAESVADYIVNPNLLQSRALDKFNFIKTRIFQGDRYVPVIREDLTFTVVDLAPDYIAPGKVKSIDIALQGAPGAEKTGSISVELFGDASPSSGAKECIASIITPSRKGNKGVVLYATKPDGSIDAGGNSTRLSGRLHFDQFAENGYWTIHRLTCTDVTGNNRYMGAVDIGSAALYVNNPLRLSVVPPAYEPGSLTLTELAPTMVEGRSLKRFQATFRLKPHIPRINGIYAPLIKDDRHESRVPGTVEYDKDSRTATVTYVVPDYFANGKYGVPMILTSDETGADGWTAFPNRALNEPLRSVTLFNDRPDGMLAPELDLNHITVTATPTQASAPNGETTVKVVFYARDDAAGLGRAIITVLNPQGELSQTHFTTNNTPGGLDQMAYEEIMFFKGDPTAWQRYEATLTLPVGSVPGLWGIHSISLTDKAGFLKIYDFVEIVHFVVTDK